MNSVVVMRTALVIVMRHRFRVEASIMLRVRLAHDLRCRRQRFDLMACPERGHSHRLHAERQA